MKIISKSPFPGIGLVLVLTAPVFAEDVPKIEKRVAATVDADGVQRVKILDGLLLLGAVFAKVCRG